MKKLLCALLALCLVLGLCACGGSSAPAGTPAESTPAESTPAESTPAESEPAESEPVCEHDWAAATVLVPETCTLCGETRGEALPTYFSENGIPVSPLPGDGQAASVGFLTYDSDDPEIFTVWDGAEVTFSRTSKPAEEEGFRQVILDIMVSFYIEGDVSTRSNYTLRWSNGLYDLYTGRKIPARDTFDNDGYSYETELTVDGIVYDLRYERENQWEHTAWTFDEDGTAWKYTFCYQTLTFLMPEEYDGLVYALFPTLTVPSSADEDTIDEEETYLLDIDPEVLNGAAFYQVGI